MNMQWIASTEEQHWADRSDQVQPAAAQAATNLRVTGREAQTIRGWGGCFNELGWHALGQVDDSERRKALDALFGRDGCRLRRCRVPIGASDYALKWYSHDEHDGDVALEHFNIERDEEYLLPYIRAAMEIRPDLDLFASAWSPPTWMKHPQAYNHGMLIWTDQIRSAYARYLVKFVQAYRERNIAISAVHVQNEPDSDHKFPSCPWTGERMRDFIRDDLRPAFDAAGLEDVEVWLGTIERPDYETWIAPTLLDDAARAATAGVGFQWAGRGAVQRTHMAAPELPLTQTENECGNGQNTWDYALYVAELIHHYLTNGVSAYTYWNMVLPPGGNSTWGWRQNAMITADPQTRSITLNPEYHVMRHLAGFIDEGAVRLETEGVWSSSSLALRNPDGSTVAFVANLQAQPHRLTVDAGDARTSMELPARSISTLKT
jgi:glucosylceramidase